MAERERAQKNSKTDDINQVALQMLVEKAQDANGSRMFGPGDVAVLKNEVRDDDLQKLMLGILNEGEEDEEEEIDLKSARKRELKADKFMLLSFGVAKELGHDCPTAPPEHHSGRAIGLVRLLRHHQQGARGRDEEGQTA